MFRERADDPAAEPRSAQDFLRRGSRLDATRRDDHRRAPGIPRQLLRPQPPLPTAFLSQAGGSRGIYHDHCKCHRPPHNERVVTRKRRIGGEYRRPRPEPERAGHYQPSVGNGAMASGGSDRSRLREGNLGRPLMSDQKRMTRAKSTNQVVLELAGWSTKPPRNSILECSQSPAVF